jgi:hypothetical protein
MNRAPGPSFAPAWRVAVAGLALAVLAASLVRSFQPAETLASARRLARDLRGDVRPLGDTTGFWFDPDYTAFLADLKAATPEDATVAVLVPRRPDLYRYQAYYQLAPRRVVEEKWKDEAAYVATYRTEAARGPGGRQIANGELRAR